VIKWIQECGGTRKNDKEFHNFISMNYCYGKSHPGLRI
jgi:hypothetical protein